MEQYQKLIPHITYYIKIIIYYLDIISVYYGYKNEHCMSRGRSKISSTSSRLTSSML